VTPAVVQLEAAGVPYRLHTYDHDPATESYGLEAARALDLPSDQVFKTLVARLDDTRGTLAVAVIPVDQMLDLKALARLAGVKRAAMADPAAAERSSGYVRGGISPFGQRRPLATYLDDYATVLDELYVSGGRRGVDISLAPDDFIRVLGAITGPLAT